MSEKFCDITLLLHNFNLNLFVTVNTGLQIPNLAILLLGIMHKRAVICTELKTKVDI